MHVVSVQKSAVLIDSVSKTFREGFIHGRYTHALKNVNLSIGYGEIFGLLGPNGAGKTTLLNICATLLIPDAGTVTILGEKLPAAGDRKPLKLKSRINMCSGNPNFPWSLTVREMLVFYAMLYGMGRSARQQRIDDCLGLLELEQYADKRYDRLSTGTKQRLALAKALINDPELLFLDEPTVGLDPDIARKIRMLIQSIHKQTGKTIIVTTHYMQEAEELCGRIAFLKKGEIIAEGTSSDLKNKLQASTLEEVFIELAH